MPDREITGEQLRSIRDWIYKIKMGEGLPRVPSPDVDIWRVDGEPLIIYRTQDDVYKQGQWDSFGVIHEHLFCSDRHAKELEEAGIVDFSD